jgi:hypothetical protein
MAIKMSKSICRVFILTLLLTSTAFVVDQGTAYALNPPALTAPANGSKVNGTSVLFTWSQVARANNYYFQLAYDAAFTRISYGGWVGNNYVGMTITGLPDDGQVLYWRVKAGNALGSSVYSSTWSVINGPSAAPATPTLKSPASGTKVGGTSVTFWWNAAARANNYYFHLAYDSAFTQIAYGGWIGNYVGMTITGLPNDGQVIYWRVKAGNALGSSVYSSTWSVINDMVCLPSNAKIGSGTGVLGNSQSHIDSCLVDATAGHFLRDMTRRANNNLHLHNGLMAPNASIDTLHYTQGLMQDDDNIWNAGGAQASGVDAHLYVAQTYDYFLSKFGLNSYNGFGISMRSRVGVTSCVNNAHWNLVDTVEYCVGSGQLPFSGALDVVGHEWAHAITDMVGANLAYQRESGALNEAFSDWMGTAIEWNAGERNWTIGEGIRVARDMSNPLAYSQPDTYGGERWINTVGCTATADNDWCGVHTNSGVGNKMFYLLSAGGTHNGVTVTGIGIEKAIFIAYRANTGKDPDGAPLYWPFDTTYSAARNGMILVAQAIYGVGSFEAKQVANAWSAVKVFGTVNP